MGPFLVAGWCRPARDGITDGKQQAVDAHSSDVIKQVQFNVPHATWPSTVNLRDLTGIRKKMPPLASRLRRALGERVSTLSLVVSKVMRGMSAVNRGMTHSYRENSREVGRNYAGAGVNERRQTKTD